MAEPLVEQEPPIVMVDPVTAEREIARRNMQWGWALFGVFVLLFGGTVLVAYAYLWLS